MTVRLSRGACAAAALVSLVAITLPLTASAQGPATPQWGTYLGGTDGDRVTAIAQTSDQDVLAVGATASVSLDPTAAPGSRAGGADIFVARFDSDGRTITEFPFQTFGGNGADEPTAAVLGPNNELYIVGKTSSSAASVTRVTTVIGSFGGGSTDAFLARISPTGTPEWFLFLSGSGDDVATGVAVTGGNVYVSGWTASPNFAGRTDGAPPGVNGFVVRVDPTAPAPPFGWPQPLLIGGSLDDRFFGLTSDLGTKLVAVGTTNSQLMSSHPDLALNTHAGGTDCFAVKLDVVTGVPEWLTFIGGIREENCTSAAIGPSGQSYTIAGTTTSPNPNGGPPPIARDAFVVSLNMAGRPRLYQVRPGGGDDEVLAVTTDVYGTAYVGGRTASVDFLGGATNFDSSIEGGTSLREGFVWMVPHEGGDGWASFVGGNNSDAVTSLALRASNRLILGMETSSGAEMPTPSFSYDSSLSSAPDGFILNVAVNDLTPPFAGQVFDRLQLDDDHDDFDETTSTTSLFANWTAFTDGTPIAKYEWAIGTMQDPMAIRPFTSVGTQLSAMATGLTLTVGQRYIVTVRAQNGHGLTSIARSDGITVVSPPPPDGGMSDGGTGGTDGGTGGDGGGTGGTDGGTGGTDGGTGGTDGGTDGGTGGTDGGKDGGTGGPDAGGGDGEDPDEDPISPVGWDLGCASAGGAALPLLLGLIALMLLRRRLGQQR